MQIMEEREAALPLLAVVLIVIVIIAIVGMALLLPWKVTNVDEIRSVDVTSNLDEIDLNVDQAVGKVTISFSNDVNDAVTLTVKGTLRQNLLSSADPLAISWSYDVKDFRLTINTKVDVQAYAAISGNDDFVTTITIPSQLSGMVNVTGSVGLIELMAGDGAALRGAHLSETTGSILAHLEGCSLRGGLDIKATTGRCTLEMTDVMIDDSAQINIDCTTGGVVMHISQSTISGGNLSVAARATTGEVDLTLNIEHGNSARVVSTSEFGGINVRASTNFIGSNSDLKSNNYPSQDKMDFAIETGAGGINLNLEYLP
jgi:hypothetical protein